MQVIKDVKTWQTWRSQVHAHQSIGFVPTMGALHEGHVSLMRHSMAECDMTILSIFVNPTQFNEPEDLKNYPRTQANDLEIAQDLGVDCVLMPDVNQMYPSGHSWAIDSQDPLSKILEGQHRPGHFSGVYTVVMKLLNLVRPQVLYLGDKDYQQARLLERMIDNFFMPIEVHICPTIRESGSFLPQSSRNQRLSVKEKDLAKKVFAYLHGLSTESLVNVKCQLESMGVKVEYLQIEEGVCFISVWIGQVRLIDHFKAPMLKEEEAC